jgi:protein-S-isoprenylcysteine O-methyltransferase Ste14
MSIRKTTVLKNAAIRIIVSFFLMFSILFLSAGSIKYWNAWLFLISYFSADIILMIYLYNNDIELLNKRLKFSEKEKIQKLFNIFNIFIILIILCILMFSGLSFRFGYIYVSGWVSILSVAVMMMSFLLSLVVMRQNRYSSRVVEIQEEQVVIDTGMYAIIRHPMYLSAILIFCPIPLILGSLYVFIPVMLIVPIVFAIRTSNEEKVLQQGLIGYKEYMKKVKYRVIPYIW